MSQELPQEPVLLHKKTMLLDQFAARFPTEESCTDYFLSVRERVGVTCAHCKGKRHKWVAYRRCFQCLDCGHWPSRQNTAWNCCARKATRNRVPAAAATSSIGKRTAFPSPPPVRNTGQPRCRPPRGGTVSLFPPLPGLCGAC